MQPHFRQKKLKKKKKRFLHVKKEAGASVKVLRRTVRDPPGWSLKLSS